MRFEFSCLLAFTCLILASADAGEIGYIEDFALAKDRAKALEQLIPGTEDYYYYHALHYQNNDQAGRVDATLKAWTKRYGYTQRIYEILNRQALLTYEKNPGRSLAFLQHRMGLHFNHQREALSRKPNLRTDLDQHLISRDTLTKKALARYSNLNGFENTALDWLVAQEMNPDRRRALLSRLNRPDYANLSRLVVFDLKYKHSRGFGSLPIHRQLLRTQLDECLKLKPDLINQTHFVNTYLSKLQPTADIDWQHDPKEKQAYLERLWAYVSRLAPAHNSLKAHVLYHRLLHDRAQGTYDRPRFLTYLQLPRRASYVNPKHLQLEQNRRYIANLSANYQSQTLLPRVGNDEPLVRSYLAHFFQKDTNVKAYSQFVNDLYLKHLFAETKIVNGLGDPEQWYSMLPPAVYQQLKERVDLEFDPTSQQVYAHDEPVRLDLHIKNVRQLIVNIYEVNTQNYYRDTLGAISTSIKLDGLVANHQQAHTFDEPPLRRIQRHFEFPMLKQRGVYIIDFIGNGKSSRALIRKGQLRYLVRTSTAGHIFTVIDESNRKLADATLWHAGREYTADEEGTIAVPFSNSPSRQPIVLSHDGFSSLDYFQHQAENYALSSGIYVDRESLLTRNKTQVLVRPSLLLNGTPVTLSVLEDVRLLIASRDRDGVTTSKEIDDFKLFEDRESTYEFQVPRRLAEISFSLRAEVKNLSQNKTIDLESSSAFQLNAIDRTDKIEDLHFSYVEGRYFVDLFGRSGEPLADRPVQLQIKHRDFKQVVHLPLETNGMGRIFLGELVDIAWLKATSPQGVEHIWTPLVDRHSYHRAVHGREGEPIEIPLMAGEDRPLTDLLSLLELRGGTFVADRRGAAKLKSGMLTLNGLAPGDYDLLLKRSGTRMHVRVTAGQRRQQHILGNRRHLEVRNRRPLQIAAVDPAKDKVTIRLANSTEFARVHVFATRYQPAYSAFAKLITSDSPPNWFELPTAESHYVAGRKIGDEYRYILDRKYTKKYPGNMLARPSLLLNPWPLRKTAAGQQVAGAGGAFEGRRSGSRRAGGAPGAARGSVQGPNLFADLDFLGDGSAVLLNLEPNEQGVVTIDRSELAGRQQLHVIAVDPNNTAYRTLALAETERKHVDLRLIKGLDPEGHFTQQKKISVVRAKGQFRLDDVTTSQFEAYDSLGRVYGLYATLNRDPKLVEFSFILAWHNMKEDEKRAKYSKYACHELNFFIYKKDAKFFRAVVMPFLANKKDKTFLDEWLLGYDVSRYLEPWHYARLNIVEQTLLAQRIEGERSATGRHVRDLFDLLPPNIERFNQLFNTAVKGSALDLAADGKLGAKYDEQLREYSARLGRRRSDDPGIVEGEADEPSNEMPDMSAALEDRADDAAQFSERNRKPGDSKSGKGGGKLKGKGRGESAGGRDNGSSDKNAPKRSFSYRMKDEEKRKQTRRLYIKLDKTEEWAENNYYRLPIEQQNAALVTVNSFWNDVASHDPRQPFYSIHLADASRSFPEMMFALSMLDIPFEPQEHKLEFAKTQMSLTSGSPMIVFHEEIRPAGKAVEQIPILVNQNFFRHGDRYRYENSERFDKFVADEFLIHTVYGCQVVVTNPTSSRQKLDVLLQVPVGAMPVSNGKYTRSLHVELQPYRTQAVEYFFYFPAPGKYQHYPVHVAKNERLITHSEPFDFNVVKELSKIDTGSWDYISQFGTERQVIDYLKLHNLQRINLEKIAFRMRNREFFSQVTELLDARHVYHNTLWSYGLKHNDVPAIQQFLQHADSFVNQCGNYLDSPLVTIDPVVRKTYQQLDYRPLVNARAHQLGQRRKIVNDRLLAQYHQLLKILSYRRQFDDAERMAVIYYLLVQDRIEEALDLFGAVEPANLAMRLQYDYFAAHLAMYREEPKQAGQIAARYADYPIDRWKNAFALVTRQIEEIVGKPASVIDSEDRNQVQAQLAATEPSFEFQVENKKVVLRYQNLDAVHVNYYLMDVEMLFSQNPFVQKYSGTFSHIQPIETFSWQLAGGKRSSTLTLPEKFHNANVLVEIVGGGQAKSQAYYATSMAVQVTDNYGQLRVANQKTGRPLPKVYVKVYGRQHNGRVKFYKDGYTDLRGRFDYSSLNTNELDNVNKFSLLVMSDEHGAVVREAAPPKR